MAKFAKDEVKPFSPIDTKMLGVLAQETPVEPISPPVIDTPPTPVAPPTAKKERPQLPASPAKPEPKAIPRKSRVPTRQAEPERLSRPVKCLFTPSEELELRNLMNRMYERSGLRLKVSHFIRPFFELLLTSEQQLGDELAAAGLHRPPNDMTALARFEKDMAAVIHAALLKTDPNTEG